MIRKLFYALGLSVVVLLTAGCNNYLTLKPTTQMTADNFYQTSTAMYKALIGTYDVLQWPGFGDNCVELVSDILSDDAGCGGGSASDTPTLQVLDNFTYTPALCPDLWGKFYAGVYRANLVIQHMPEVKGDTTGDARMLAEAYFLRTYYYYQLWRFYGYVPVYTENLIPSQYYTVKQDTPDQLYAFLIDQLDNDVIGKLPSQSQLDPSQYGRVTNGAAIALKARIVLLQNDQTKMSEIASQLTSLINSNQYALVPNFQSIWLQGGEYDSESVFEINFTDNSQWNDWSNMKGTDGNYQVQVIGARGLVDPSNTFNPGWGFSPVSQNLYNAYPTNDQRRDATILNADKLGWTYDNTAWQNTGCFSAKYAPRVGYTCTTGGIPALNYNNNIRVIRYSDVLLMAAEAILRSSGNVANAQSNFDQVTHRAYGPTYTETVTLAGIYRERRLEFALEGIRYWDLVRTQTTYPAAAATLQAMGWTTAKRYLPIPQTEIDNAQGALKQYTAQ
jgi:hypothetical protein